MDYLHYAHTIGYLRIREKMLLSGESFGRIIDSPNAAEAAKLISQNSEYDFSALPKVEDYETVMGETLKKTYSRLYFLAPEKTAIDIILCKYDYHNLKTAAKSKYLGKDHSELYIACTETDPALIAAAVAEGAKPKQLPSHLLDAAAMSRSSLENGGSPQTLDVVLDLHMFGHMLNLAKTANNAFLLEYAQFATDFYNVRTMLRLKNMGGEAKFLKEALCEGGKLPKAEIFRHFEKNLAALGEAFHYKYFGEIMKASLEDYEKTGDFSGLEKRLDDFLMDHAKKSKYIAFGPEIFMSYVFSKENEARQIRTIMNCKINNMPAAAIRERLRDNYA
ncbi:MAG: V-type ATPase subunit [Oscillospiraceae bacterium]|nr:V-type ATPase subunit [Oscillospiraceae bacterium]